MFPISETEFFHIDSKSRLENAFFEKQWVILYRHESKKPDLDYICNTWMWTYLVEPSVSSKAIESFVEDVRWDEAGARWGDEQRYERYSKKGFEQLVIVLDFFDAKPFVRQIRIHEDFIYMFRLYEENIGMECRNYVQYKDGEKEIVIVVTPNEVKIRHSYLTDFLASRKQNMMCAIHSEVNIPLSHKCEIPFSYKYTGHQGITERPGTNTIFNFSTAVTGTQFQSWFRGKQLVTYKNFGDFKSTFDTRYESFIVGYDHDKCDDKELRCDCQDNAEKYLRIFFKKGVLEKYRNNPSASVGPNSISSSEFVLRCDNDSPDHIWTFLKDLSSLPYSEQQHWKIYNIPPLETQPSNFWIESQDCWNAIPSSPDFLFRYLFKEANRKWEKMMGWVLFRPTTNAQSGALERLFILGYNHEGSFRNLILTLNLVLSESINVQELNKIDFPIPKDKKKGIRGVMLLNYFLESKGFPKNPFINFLLKLGTLRSQYSEAHRNSNVCDDILAAALEFIGLCKDSQNYTEASINLFLRAQEAFKYLLSIIPSFSNEQKNSSTIR